MPFCWFEDPLGFSPSHSLKKVQEALSSKRLHEELISLLVANDLQQSG
jgi:hypothetical protein